MKHNNILYILCVLVLIVYVFAPACTHELCLCLSNIRNKLYQWLVISFGMLAEFVSEYRGEHQARGITAHGIFSSCSVLLLSEE